MGMTKNIYWRDDMKTSDGKPYATVHLTVGYNQGTLADYRQMAEELKKTFPQATDNLISCGKILRSSHMEGHSIVSWHGHLEKTDYPGWRQQDGIPEYNYY